MPRLNEGLLLSSLALVLALLLVMPGASERAWAADWEQVTSKSGAYPDSTDGGGKAKAPSRPHGPYTFDVKGRAVRFKWSTETAGRNPDFRIELEKRIYLNNGGNRWQRVATFGRTHESVKDQGKAFESGPGSYRFTVLGHAMSYNVSVEAVSGGKD
jgi:hypothetical protein